jgi:two-component system, NtrC family, response regulator HydG
LAYISLVITIMGKSFQALVIDDDLEICQILQKVLNQLGCNVIFADSAEKGIEKFATVAFDLVFVALCIREIGARGVARWVRYRFPQTKVMATTSWKGELDKTILSFDGIHDVVHKPFKINEIRHTVIRHLG